MTRTKFIELLNLYLDHQIGAEETALLEQELQQNPEHRRLYRQYCQMQKACSRLAENFREEAPQPAVALAEAGPSSRKGVWYATLGGLAAAAALTVLLTVNRTPAPSLAAVHAANLLAKSESVAVRPALSMPAQTAPRQAFQTVYAPTLLSAHPETAGSPSLLASDSLSDFSWMNQVRLAPVPVDNGHYTFQVQPANADETRTVRTRQPFQGSAEMISFQFQR